ncbi:hypothetical protein HW115_05190 [Verrucomicrobiaceae bacterium N1E253]|uniref:Tetratricopeptide repeat protein n=1 Tax=Oceaniferula marina TaxID=2748318 RepID=A0A851GDH7_9BACT|nr:hypothetical protein [Oceaniferula marina]NWK54992.1 hypothetical protein [Oceaniferula marina]
MKNTKIPHDSCAKTKSRMKRTAPALTVILLAVLGASAINAQELPDLTSISKKAPDGLREKTQTKRSALFYIARPTQNGVAVEVGFFFGEKGLAVCHLRPFCRKEELKFHLADKHKTPLKAPTVVATFPKEELALIKFADKPKGATSLSISTEATPVGSWIAVLSPEVASDLVLGPILSHRTTAINYEMKNPEAPAKQFSFATGRGPRQNAALFRGAPLLNLRGEVVALYHSPLPLPIQTFRLATPTQGLSDRIAGAVKKGERLDTPLRAEDHGFDPVEFTDEWQELQIPLHKRNIDFAKADQLVRDLVEKFPNSFLVQQKQFTIENMKLRSSSANPTKFVELAKGLKHLAKDHAAAEAFYLVCLGDALFAAGKIEEATAALKKADKLYPAGGSAGTLAHMYAKKGNWEQAEYYYRRIILLTPERIAFWDDLQTVLISRGKMKEADEVSDRVFLLEDFYRSR